VKSTCVASVEAHGGYQSAGSGSIPAATLHLWIDETDAAETLVKRFHYSRRWPSNVQLVVTAHESGGLFGNKGEALAAVVYSIPGPRWSKPVWELSRLVRRDDSKVPLSWLIARSVGIIRKRKAADLLVSFADKKQSHHGGVYKASNWRYAGLRAPADEGVMVDGLFVPGRSANSRWGTRSVSKLAAKGITATRVIDEGKHLFYMPVSAMGKTWAGEMFL
jgi:hypothetical protein